MADNRSASCSRIGDLIQWKDSSVSITVPKLPAGKYSIRVRTADGMFSNTYGHFKMLTGPQTAVRFVVRQALTAPGEQVYLVGNVSELGNWNPDHAIGPMFNRIVYTYPTWYYDVSVPINTTIEYKFIKKDREGNITWEGGPNHMISPSADAGTVDVTWQSEAP